MAIPSEGTSKTIVGGGIGQPSPIWRAARADACVAPNLHPRGEEAKQLGASFFIRSVVLAVRTEENVL